MSDRVARRPAARPCRPRLFPSVEDLEGRALMSYGGGLDFTFGGNGTAPLYTSLYGQVTLSAKASEVQADGKLVVVGMGFTNSFGSGGSGFTDGFYAARYNPDGTYDRTFDGTNLFRDASLSASGFNSLISHTPVFAQATGLAIQPDGKIVVVGDVNGVARAARLKADGTLDPSFGVAGVVTLGTAATGDAKLDYASSVALLPGGLIAVGGATSPTAGDDSPAVEVLNGDGMVHTSFGTNGLAAAPVPPGVQAYVPITPVVSSSGGGYTSPGYVGLVSGSNGQVTLAANGLIGGSGPLPEITLTRFTASGTLDGGFGAAGQAVITPHSTFVAATADAVTAIALQPDGKLIVGGSVSINNTLHAVVLRVGVDGSPDPTFATPGGDNILGYTTPVGSSPGAIAIQPDGKIVVVDEFFSDFERLRPNGLPDHSFGVHGTALYVQPPDYQYRLNGGSVGVAVQADGKLLVTQSFGLLRLLGKGSAGDYDNDGVSDRSVEITSTATFAYAASSGPPATTVQFGIPGAGNSLPAPGNYFGGGQDDIAVYLPSRGAFAVRQPTLGYSTVVPFGMPGAGNSLPAPGDFDGSGRTEYGVYLPQSGTFAYRRNDGGGDVSFAIGLPGPGRSIPTPADYFGSAQDDVAVYEPSTANFVIRDPLNGQVLTIPFGTPGQGDIPVAGDFDGAGRAELAIYIPNYGQLIYRPASGAPDVTIPFGMPGVGNTLPAPGDYDGAGRTEVAAYLPTPGVFAYRSAVTGNDIYLVPFGVPGQTVPFTLGMGVTSAGAGTSGLAVHGEAVAGSAVDIPLTPDVLDGLAGAIAKKKTGHG